jgi:hypothetical protein
LLEPQGVLPAAASSFISNTVPAFSGLERKTPKFMDDLTAHFLKSGFVTESPY